MATVYRGGRVCFPQKRAGGGRGSPALAETRPPSARSCGKKTPTPPEPRSKSRETMCGSMPIRVTERELYSAAEVARAARVPVSAVRACLNNGQAPVVDGLIAHDDAVKLVRLLTGRLNGDAEK